MFRIESKRLMIVPYRQEHIDDFLEFYNHSETMKYVSTGRSDWSKDELLKRMKSLSGDELFGVYSVVLKPENKVIGEISFFDSYNKREKIEIGYILNPKYHGKGYATEMLGAVLDYLKSELGIKTIIARVNGKNVNSVKL